MASQPVNGIRPVEPQPSLLTSARKTPFGFDVWKSGVTFRDTALLIGGRWPYAPGTDHDDKADAVQAQVAEFIPFTIYLPVSCDEATYAREEELTAEAIANAEAETAWEMGRELWTGETVNASAMPDNPSLMSPYPGGVFPPSHIISAVAVDPVVAMGDLIQAYSDATHKGGVMLHVPAIAIPYLLAEKVIGQQGAVYRGPMDSIVVPGPGYPAAGAFGPDGAVAAANTAWMYASGPVEHDETPIRVLPEDQAARFFDRRTNLWSIWAERMAFLRFDPSAVFARAITVPQTDI